MTNELEIIRRIEEVKMPREKINKEHDLGYKHLLTHKKTFIELLKSFVRES